MAGKLVKLQIIAYEDDSYNTPTGAGFTTLLNPETFSESVKIEYNTLQAFGTTSDKLKFNKIKPQELEFDLLFDATGVVNNGISQYPDQDVSRQIAFFKSVALNYNGNIHSPNHVKIIWGELIFKSCLIELNITYTLFKADGTPLRAKAKARFRESIAETLSCAMANKSSPDLTHLREVGAGDTLPLMANRIYGNSADYIKVAKYNNLKAFRVSTHNMVARTEIRTAFR